MIQQIEKRENFDMSDAAALISACLAHWPDLLPYAATARVERLWRWQGGAWCWCWGVTVTVFNKTEEKDNG